jgi:hypothetical protein
MYLITIESDKESGAYSVIDSDGDKILYLFEEEDDASRFAMLLEENGYPKMLVYHVEDEIIYKVCSDHNHKYAVFTQNDIVIPPEETL